MYQCFLPHMSLCTASFPFFAVVQSFQSLYCREESVLPFWSVRSDVTSVKHRNDTCEKNCGTVMHSWDWSVKQRKQSISALLISQVETLLCCSFIPAKCHSLQTKLFNPLSPTVLEGWMWADGCWRLSHFAVWSFFCVDAGRRGRYSSAFECSFIKWNLCPCQ